MQEMTPYLQQLILHGALDSIEDTKWLSKDSVVSSYLRVRCDHSSTLEHADSCTEQLRAAVPQHSFMLRH